MRGLLLLAFVLAGCAPAPHYRSANESATVEPQPEPGQEPDAGEPPPRSPAMELRELAVPDHLPAIAAVPASGAELPLVIAAHGAGGSPEWQCQHWARIVAGRALVLCPRGRRISLRSADEGMYYYPDHFALEREVMAMVTAARQTFGTRLSRAGGIYTGFSQGATMGALMIVDHAGDFPYLLLIEGATSEFSAQRARRFAAGGGKSVAFVCGGRHCATGAENMAQVLRRAGLEARAEYVPRGGHTDDGPVGERASAVFEEMLAQTLAASD